MREIQNVLLFVVLGILTIFAVQNSSSFVLPLVFLGMRSLALPLSAWVLGAFFAGVITALIIGALFKFYTLLTAGDTGGKRRAYSGENDIPPRQPSPRTDTVLQDNYGRTERVYSETISGGAAGWSRPNDNFDDTLRGRREEQRAPRYQDVGRRNNYSEPDIDEDEFYEDWDEETPENRSQETKAYEVSQAPKSSSWTGSVYSYTYRESAEPEAEKIELIPEKKTEPVTDADYRVIIPPPASNTPPPPVEDDWGKKKKPKSDDW